MANADVTLTFRIVMLIIILALLIPTCFGIGKVIPSAIAQSSGEDINSLYSRGIELYEQGMYEQAIGYFDRVLAIEPNDVFALSGKGDALAGLGRLEEAIVFYDRALAIAPDDVYVLAVKGDALVSLGRLEEAIVFYDRALAIAPDDILSLNNIGAALGELGRYQEAIGYYDRVLNINPNYSPALNNKGAALGELGSYEEAIGYFDQALIQESGTPLPDGATTSTPIPPAETGQESATAPDDGRGGPATLPPTDEGVGGLEVPAQPTQPSTQGGSGGGGLEVPALPPGGGGGLEVPALPPPINPSGPPGTEPSNDIGEDPSTLITNIIANGYDDHSIKNLLLLLLPPLQSYSNNLGLGQGAGNMLLGNNLQAYEERGKLHYITLYLVSETAIAAEANKGIALFHQENYQDAIDIFDKILANNERHIDSLYYKAQCLQQLGYVDQANQHMNIVYEINPNYKAGFIEVLVTSIQGIFPLFQ